MSERPLSEWERRRRLAEVFGEVLPDTTRDERDDVRPSVGPSESTGSAESGESGADRWLREQVPPHHGG